MTRIQKQRFVNSQYLSDSVYESLISLRISNILTNYLSTTEDNLYDIFFFSQFLDRDTFHKIIKKCVKSDLISCDGVLLEYRSNKRRAIINKTLKDQIDEEMSFGTEIEFASKVPAKFFAHLLIDLQLRDATIKCSPSYKTWNVTRDDSIDIDDFEHQIEIVSCPLVGSEGLVDLKKVLTLLSTLKKMGVIKQNKTCGGHVHHGFAKSRLKIENLVWYYMTCQPVLDKIVARHRVVTEQTIIRKEREGDSVYMEPISLDDFYNSEGKFKICKERYKSLNTSETMKKGTVEWRQFQASTDFNKLASWIILNQKVMKASEVHSPKQFRSMKSFFKTIKLHEAVQSSLMRNKNISV